ncbi:hypothetical protein ACXX81_06585 [Pseudomonas sp. GNP013]
MFSIFNTCAAGFRDEYYRAVTGVCSAVRHTPEHVHQRYVYPEPSWAFVQRHRECCRLAGNGLHLASLFRTVVNQWRGVSASVESPLHVSTKAVGEQPDDIWRGFRQSNQGNCVTVAAIKVAMARFGQSPVSIFERVQRAPRGYDVTLRDGHTLSVSNQELSQAAREARFKGADAGMLKDANFLFAVSAKRAQEQNNDGTAGASFSAAINSLNDGEDEQETGEALKRLGLSRYVRKTSVAALACGQLGMINTDAHSVAVIGGHEELWGRRGGGPREGEAVALV